MPTITGTPGDDTLVAGTPGNDELRGLDGNDTLRGLTGRDTLLGSAGDDFLAGDAGADLLEGGAGADSLDGGGRRDTADYRASGAALTLDLRDGTAAGGDAEGDRLVSVEDAIGTGLDDTMRGSLRGNALLGLGGADTLEGRAGADRLAGGFGADSLDGGKGIDIASYLGSSVAVTVSLATGLGFWGEAEGDRLTGIEALDGSAADDHLEGDGGANALHGNSGRDVLSGRGGSDHLFGGSQDDTLHGGGGDDFLFGTTGADTVRGGAGADTLYGGLPRDEGDILVGGAGADMLFGIGGGTLAGGTGADRFVFTNPGQREVVRDFEPGIDVIEIDESVPGDPGVSVIALANGTAAVALDFAFLVPHLIILRGLAPEDILPGDILIL